MIAESELILSPEGRVYHLNLNADELAGTVITVGDPERVAQVSKYFDLIEHRSQNREFVAHTGTVGKKRLTVLSTGIGADNIDIVMNELDALVNIDLQNRVVKEKKTSLTIIRLGSSGSLQEDIPVDSLLLSTHGIGLDNVLHFYPLQETIPETELRNAFVTHAGLQHTPINPYVVESSARLAADFKDGYHRGITVTCPGFYAPQGRILRSPLQFPDLINRLSSFNFQGHRITNFEMETAALFGFARVFGHHCLSVNTIVANRISKTFTRDAGKSIENMIQKSLTLIEKIPEHENPLL